MSTLLVYLFAAVGEIAGCFSFWAWLRLGRSACWVIPGMVSLAMFAWALTRIDVSHAGRAYAAYGGVYIVASLMWLWWIEGLVPSRWDILGATVSITGAAIILVGPTLGCKAAE